MVMLRTLMLLAGTFAVLLLGGVPAQAADVPPPACHEAPASPHSSGGHHAPDKAMKAMGCCVVCSTGLNLLSGQPSEIMKTALPVRMRPAALPEGRAPAPEHGPPRA